MPLRDGLVTHPSVSQRYRHLVETGKLHDDPAQGKLAAALDRVMADIDDHRLARKSSALGWLFAKRRDEQENVTGLYVHGGVGRGKTMLMDMFFALVPVKAKRRAHFNDFMADVHDRIGRQREAFKSGESRERDPIPPVAEALADEAWVLCFDEFSVTDIADAMILSRLFSALFKHGVVLVATSNVAPDDLYRDGLNRGLFEPFIEVLKRHAHVLHLQSDKDYRLEMLSRLQVYMTPANAGTDRRMDEAWEAVTDGRKAMAEEIEVKGREIHVAKAAGSAARFTFADLCAKPLGARDYIALARRFDTIFIDHIPVIGDGRRNEAKRFILLIDTLYDSHTRLIASAEAAPDALYAARTGTEAFEFQHTASRLVEMQSRDWLAGAAGDRARNHADEAAGAGALTK